MLISNHHRGFSLIEIAIAVVVIGIITGFVFKGTGLIQTTKLRATIAQVDAIKAATQMFSDKYGGLPGTLQNASELFSEKIGNGRGCEDFSTIESAKLFFSHLNASGIIALEMKDGFAVARVGGIFTVSSNIPEHPGIWLVLCESTEDNQTFPAVLTAEDGHFIDKNFDTGDPTMGDVIAIKGKNATDDCVSSGKYNLKSKSKNCVLLFRIS